MTNIIRRALRRFPLLLVAVGLGLGGNALAQDFDYHRLDSKVREFSVIIRMKIEISFGVHSAEQEERYLGTIVGQDGLVIFNGASLDTDGPFSELSGMGVRTNPTDIEVERLDGRKYDGEFLGVDKFTRIGFVQILHPAGERFPFVEFEVDRQFKVGDWLTLYMLLPEFIAPSLAADVGMVSSLVQSPEDFPLTVGFSQLQLNSVLFNENLEPVGVLGTLVDPSLSGSEAMESFGQTGIPLLGIIRSERLLGIIADPPRKGQTDKGWLGIRLQAMTKDIADYWSLDTDGGIIVNEVMRGSPADLAGLVVGDVIFEVNGEPVGVDRDENLPVFQRKIAEIGPGSSVELTVARPRVDAADTITTIATLTKAPLAASDAADWESESLEFKVRDLVFDDYLFYNQDPETFHGVFVAELKQGGLSSVGGLRFGDVIQRIGTSVVTSVDEAREVLEQIDREQPSEVIFFVWRDNKTMFVNVKTDWQ